MTDATATILVVDDEQAIRRFLRIALEAHGYAVHESRSGAESLDAAGHCRPDLVILDMGLPDMDGLQVITRLREWSDVPILILSVRDDESGKVAALDGGANDYVTKPAGISELMARVRVLLRHRQAADDDRAVFEHDGLQADLARRAVRVDGTAVRLTRKEYEGLRLLVRNAGRVVTHQAMLRELWGPAYVSQTHYLRVLMSSLRQKLGDDPAEPRWIATEQGVGYRLLD